MSAIFHRSSIGISRSTESSRFATGKTRPLGTSGNAARSGSARASANVARTRGLIRGGTPARRPLRDARHLPGRDDTMQPHAMSAGATLALVRAVRGIRYEEIPADALEAARHCLLDFLGCALAGSREPLTGILVESVAETEGGGRATLIGRPERATRLGAALGNGAAGDRPRFGHH